MRMRRGVDWRQGFLMWALLALLGIFILYPVARVLWVSLSDDQGRLTLLHFVNFFRRPLFREALWNSLLSGVLVVFFGSLIAVPLAYISARYEFRGKIALQTLSTLPLVIPPFVGAVALQMILGRSGMVNLLLMRWFDTTIPFMEGMTGVVLVQTLHYFPFIMLNTAVSLSNIEASLEEAAENMGCHGWRLFRRITLPLMLPGYIAGSLIAFIRVIDDLGTPLMLNYKNLLAAQAYLRITTIGIDDVDGYVICVVLVLLSLASLFGARKYLAIAEYATVQRGAPVSERLSGGKRVWILLFIGLALGVSLLPHIGIAVLSFAKIWSFSILPSIYTLDNYVEIFFRVPHFVKNTLLYTLIAAGLDVLLGAAIAFLLVRSRLRGRNLLDAIATLPLAIPGVVLAVGYIRVFHGWDFPGIGGPLTSSWIILVIAYTVRRLPYTVRASYAALQQVHVSLEEAAQNLGANRFKTYWKVTVPLIAGGLVAGGLIAFVTSCVELASTIMLVPRIEMGPISYGIYIYMQSPLGRSAGAALGVVAILLVGLGTYLTHRVFGERAGSAFRV
ncbi:MAG: ABC transporter permease [Deltaproteobacteria bacterium RIFCSPLOWO2_12_FULL_60_19]|nr:MAG: ABC transporter permease [Deltaproteobacteria bacterium RIFCSPLOWO2_12_FULL_60_19]